MVTGELLAVELLRELKFAKSPIILQHSVL